MTVWSSRSKTRSEAAQSDRDDPRAKDVPPRPAEPPTHAPPQAVQEAALNHEPVHTRLIHSFVN